MRIAKTLLVAFLTALSLTLAAQSQPSEHILKPVKSIARKSPFKSCRSFGSSIAVFGGSLSVLGESDAAKQQWANELGATVVSYGVCGAGFSCDQGYSLQRQVDTAGVHDIYVLWASTNDFMNNRECGSWKDYSETDGFDESKLTTQCGGINYCIKRIMEKNPRARIVFFTGLRFFSSDSGHNPMSVVTNKTGKTFADYIQGQKDCCAHHGIPVLDQFSIQDVNEFNYQLFYKKDKLHMNEDGYLRIAPKQVEFLAR